MRKNLVAGIRTWVMGVVCALMMVFPCGAESSNFTIEEREAQVPLGASLSAVGVHSPVGHLLLLRRGSALCAVRFTAFHRDHDDKPQTWYHSGGESFYAEYDWYLPGPNVGYFRGPVELGNRTVDRQPLIGLGRMGFQRGTTDIECGSFTPGWYYPTGVAFEEGGGIDYELELAPTQWTEVSQINLQDPNLIWYRYNESQKPTFIPLKELPSAVDDIKAE